jgi:hypothetical protein
MANKYMKKYSSSLVVKEMKFKTTVRFHLIPVRLAIIKKKKKKRKKKKKLVRVKEKK